MAPPPANLELLHRLLLEAVEEHPAQPTQGGQAPATRPRTFYTFSDKSGSHNVVDTFERVPAAYREQAKEWMLAPVATVGKGHVEPWTLHAPSMLVGIGATSVACLVLLVVKRFRWLLWVGLLVTSVGAVGGAYALGLRPPTGDARAWVERARQAVQQLQKANERHAMEPDKSP